MFRKWHFLGPLALAFSSPIKKSFLQHCITLYKLPFFLFEQLFTALLVAKNGMTPSFSLFGALQLNGLTKKSDNVSS
jgi:hypothetical protein